jgi:hypothetical protein
MKLQLQSVESEHLLIDKETNQRYSRKKNGWYSVCDMGFEDKIEGLNTLISLEKQFMSIELPNTQYNWYKVTMEELENDLIVDYNERTHEYSWECWGSYENGFDTKKGCERDWLLWAEGEIANSKEFVEGLKNK